MDGIASRILCCEKVDGQRWSYVPNVELPRSFRLVIRKAVASQNLVSPIDEHASFVRSHIVLEDFP